MKIRILGNGTFNNSKVINEETGEMIEYVVGCRIEFTKDNYPGYRAYLEILSPGCDVIADWDHTESPEYHTNLLRKIKKLEAENKELNAAIEDMRG